MVTLRIEHPITDFATWVAAFDRFAAARRSAGVRAQRISRPLDDPAYVIVDLDFDTADAAAAFREFLVTVVWTSPAASPALAGTPNTVLQQRSPAR